MQCKSCGFDNSEDDHRCLRCGRRLSGMVVAAPPGYSGANALAAAPILTSDTTQEFLAARDASLLSKGSSAAQQALFTGYAPAGNSPNVIPFDELVRQAANRAMVRTPDTVRRLDTRATVAQTPPPPIPSPARDRKAAAPPRVSQKLSDTRAGEMQGTLDFIPGAPSKGRKLKTDVDAQVFCDQPVATPTHRFVASAIDAAMIMIGFGLIVVTFEAMGGSFGAGKVLWLGLGAVLALVAMFYGLIWAIAGRETAGMRFADLQLITFDGFPLDARSRALRFASSWLSFCSAGLGLLWAMADEESLTWHDHISKTFPTVREVPGTFVRPRR